MKKIQSLLIIFSICSTSTLLANPCQKVFGLLTCSGGATETIQFTGLAQIKGTTVTNNLDVLGTVDISHATINRLHIRGYTQLNNTTVTHAFDITGQVQADHLTVFSPLNVTGNFNVKNGDFTDTSKIVGRVDCSQCRFKTTVNFTGQVQTDQSIFLGPLSLEGRSATFTNTQLTDVYIRRPSQPYVQRVMLAGNSVAHNLTFENDQGEVILSGNAKITGKVTGGKIIKH